MDEGGLRERGNLGEEAQNWRLRAGIAALAVALALAAAIDHAGLSRGYWIALAAPFLVASGGITMGLFRTSVRLAARGMRDYGAGPERIKSPSELAGVRRRARRVGLIAVAAALVATGLLAAAWLPGF
jgi:hypothetical protein